jgi:hypothetical protein
MHFQGRVCTIRLSTVCTFMHSMHFQAQCSLSGIVCTFKQSMHFQAEYALSGRACMHFQAEYATPPPLTHCILVYIHTGKGGGGGGRGEQERWLGGQQFTKLGRKYQHDWLYLQSINSDKHLTQSPFTGQFF